MDFVFKVATLSIRNKKVGFYVIDDTLKGVFCEKALQCVENLEKFKSSISFENIDKVKEISDLQKEIEERMDLLVKKIKELK